MLRPSVRPSSPQRSANSPDDALGHVARRKGQRRNHGPGGRRHRTLTTSVGPMARLLGKLGLVSSELGKAENWQHLPWISDSTSKCRERGRRLRA